MRRIIAVRPRRQLQARPLVLARAAPARSTPTRWPPVLSLLVLTAGCRTVAHFYSAVGLARDDELTALGRLHWPLLAVASIVWLRRRPWRPRRLPARSLLVVFALVGLSSFWSGDLPRTGYQFVVLVSVAICSAYFTSRHSARDALVLVANYLAVVTALNVIAVVLGLSQPVSEGALMEHKNLLGFLAATGALTALLASGLVTRRHRRLLGASAVLGIGLLLACEARSAVFSVAVAGAAVVVVQVRRREPLTLVLGVMAFVLPALVGVYFAVGGIESVLNASGKDLTLTGRTEVWRYAIDLAGRRPTLGWGYFALWGDVSFDDHPVPASLRFDVRSAHSGYVEMYVGVGLVGLGALLAALGNLVHWSYVRALRFGPVGLWSLAICVLAAIQNLSETVVPGSVQTMVLLLLLIATARRWPGPRRASA